MSLGPSLDLDFLVVGGGPAGSACAIQLAKAGGRVAIVESSDFSQFRIGETLEPSLGPTLLQLGLEIEKREWSAPCLGITAAWGRSSAARRPNIFSPYGGSWRVDRRKFDRALFERARNAGATAFLEARVTSAARHAECWTYGLRRGDSVASGRAKWIVAATGRGASLPFAPSRSRTWIDRLVGLAFVKDGRAEDRGTVVGRAIVAATPRGWWYSATIPEGSQVAVFFSDADILPKGGNDRAEFLLTELRQCPLMETESDFVAALIGQRRWIGFDARSSIHHVVVSDGWAAVGDAIMAFDPLCGRGISEAINSGMEVADWMLRWRTTEPARDELPAWVGRAADRFNRYRDERRSAYCHETRWPASMFWQRRHIS